MIEIPVWVLVALLAPAALAIEKALEWRAQRVGGGADGAGAGRADYGAGAAESAADGAERADVLCV